MDIEERPLLFEDDEKLGNDLVQAHSPKKRSRAQSWAIAVATHGLVGLLVFVAVVFSPLAHFLPYTQPRSTRTQPTLYSPLEPAIKYTIDHPPWDLWSNPLYFGPPSDDSERAWNRLIHPHGIQIFPEEADHFDETNTVLLKNGNYLFILGLYHNLHCLRRIRQTLNADHYYPNMTEEQREHDLEHTGHCLEAIRTSIMCHPDLTPNRFYWSDRPWHDLSVRPDVTRECINWDSLEGFMRGRRYDAGDILKTHGEDLDPQYGG